MPAPPFSEGAGPRSLLPRGSRPWSASARRARCARRSSTDASAPSAVAEAGAPPGGPRLLGGEPPPRARAPRLSRALSGDPYGPGRERPRHRPHRRQRRLRDSRRRARGHGTRRAKRELRMRSRPSGRSRRRSTTSRERLSERGSVSPSTQGASPWVQGVPASGQDALPVPQGEPHGRRVRVPYKENAGL